MSASIIPRNLRSLFSRNKKKLYIYRKSGHMFKEKKIILDQKLLKKCIYLLYNNLIRNNTRIMKPTFGENKHYKLQYCVK